MNRLAALSICTALLLASGQALGQVASQDSAAIPTPWSYAPSMLGIVAKLVISMILIIGLIYISTFLLKKMNSRTSGGQVIGDAIRVLGRTFISPKHCLYLVKIGEKYAVLGVTDSNISLITEMSKDEVDRSDGQGSTGKDISPSAKFGEFLKGMLRP